MNERNAERQTSKARLTFSPLNMNAKPNLIEGETFFVSETGIENNALLDYNEKIIAEGGRIWITNFRIILRFYVSLLLFFFVEIISIYFIY